MGDIGGELLIILVLLLANGFFAGSEIAIVSARKGRLEGKAAAGSRGAKEALKLQANSDRFLATVQVGITLIGTFSAAFGGARIAAVVAVSLEPALGDSAESVALLLVVLGITYFSLIIGELVPKQLALRMAEGWATLAAPIMRVLAIVTGPVVSFLTLSVRFVFRLLRQKDTPDTSVTPEDIMFMAHEGAARGGVDHDEAQLIRRVFEFGGRMARDVMTPRTEFIAVGEDQPITAIADTLLRSRFTRLPVYRDNLDHIVGMLNAKDVVFAMLSQGKIQTIENLIREIHVVPETLPLDDVLTLFRMRSAHMVIVIDEHGQTAGLLTLEDLLEELVGEIRDEYDQAERAPIRTLKEGVWIVEALEPYDRVVKLVGLPKVDEDDNLHFSTFAGYLLYHLDTIPTIGERYQVAGYEIQVIEMDGRRIAQVLIRKDVPATDA